MVLVVCVCVCVVTTHGHYNDHDIVLTPSLWTREGFLVEMKDCVALSIKGPPFNLPDNDGNIKICHIEDNSMVTLSMVSPMMSRLGQHFLGCPLDLMGPCVESINDDTVTLCSGSVPVFTVCYSGIYTHSIESECVHGQVKPKTVAECELDAPWTPESAPDDAPDGIDNKDVCDPSTITPEDLWKLMNEMRLQWAERDRRIFESLENSHQSIQSKTLYERFFGKKKKTQ